MDCLTCGKAEISTKAFEIGSNYNSKHIDEKCKTHKNDQNALKRL